MNDDQLQEFFETLTPDQRAAMVKDLARRKQEQDKLQEVRQVSYSVFKQQFWPNYQETAFQRAIDVVLMQVATYILTAGREGIGRAMIFMPPRHGKTTNVSRLFPAWLLSQMPELQILMVSYADNLAVRNGRFVRNLMLSGRYQSEFPVRLIGTRADEWYTNANGGVLSAGFNGQITGSGGRLIIVDDPHKNRREAESPTIRQNIKDGYTDDVLTRLEEPGGAILIMQTRWHNDDLSGWLLSQEDAEDWYVLKLPALAGEHDPLGRSPGEALWPGRYPVELLEKRRAKMGTYSFASLYQQEPISKEAALFDTALIDVIDEAPVCKRIGRFYDLAVSAKSTADYSVGLKLGITEDEDLIVLDLYRLQATPATTGENIIRNAVRDGKAVPIRLEADNSSRTQLDYLLRDERLRGYIIDLVSPIGDKYVRAAPLESRVKSGKLKIVRASWNDAFLDELSVFPAGRNDDQVDALSGGYHMLSEVVEVPMMYQALVVGRGKPQDKTWRRKHTTR